MCSSSPTLIRKIREDALLAKVIIKPGPLKWSKKSTEQRSTGNSKNKGACVAKSHSLRATQGQFPVVDDQHALGI